MKSLQLDISLEGIQISPEDKEKTPQSMCVEIISSVISAYGGQKRGFNEIDRRKYYKIMDVFEEALKNPEIKSVNIEEDWMSFIKICFRDVTLMPNKLLKRVEENIASAK